MAHNQDAASHPLFRQTRRLTGSAADVARAATVLRHGGLVAFPTETVYGLGADATSDAAVAGIYAAKDRPQFNPLIVHVPTAAAARDIARFSDLADRLAAAFWPGPLTLVLPLAAPGRLSRLVTAGLDSVALRVPAAPLAQALLRAADLPIAAPSANPSGRISPTTAAHVLAGLDGRIDALVDGGSCAVGVESTIVDLTGPPRLLRPGGVAAEDLEAALGQPLLGPETGPAPERPVAPGQLSSHYAPRARVRLNATGAVEGEVFLGFGPCPGATRNLSETGDLMEATANLFTALHDLDNLGAAAIAVAPIPDHGLGAAINDRLRRAAAPR
ncbi:MAG: threonylcarbamoyl-AMP synthase [Rhodobacteraceae bacterium]|nr:threonylcarbamoyl-AMP synthase [Paracoccaceae bacterium]